MSSEFETKSLEWVKGILPMIVGLIPKNTYPLSIVRLKFAIYLNKSKID